MKRQKTEEKETMFLTLKKSCQCDGKTTAYIPAELRWL
jgi:hypothetical protein